MSDSTSRFEHLIDRINILWGLIIPVGTFTFAAILLWIFVPHYFQAGSLLIYIYVIVSVGLVFLLHYLYVDRLNRPTVRFLYFYYHAALITFCAVVAPYLSPFDFLWAVLAIGMDLLFGRRWMILTLLSYLASLVISFHRTSQVMSTETALITLAQIIGIIGTTLLVSRYRQVSDEERVALDTSSQNRDFERQRLLSLINNMGEAVIATNAKGKVLLYNAAALNLLDTNTSLENKSLDIALKLHDNATKRVVKMTSILKSHPEGITSTEYTHTFAPNDLMNLYINIAPIKLGFKEHLQSGYIIIMRDITKEKSLEEERDEFISVVSHELRTPIAIAEGTISNAQFITDKHDSKEAIKNALEQAHTQVVFLSKMINDLATLSRAERSNVPMEYATINLSDFMEELRADYQKDAADKHLTLTATVAKNTEPLVTSPLYLQEILQNFITNAIKYTKEGSILLNARSDQEGTAIFSVADSGIGLSKADQKRVFEKFFRSEDYRTRESSGTGLGLYVTMKLAKRINATITLESELNKGSVFTITVPQLSKTEDK